MDQAFEKISGKLKELKGYKELDEYLKLWSKTVENTWLEHLEVDENTVKQVKGRGQVKLTRSTPKVWTKNATDDAIRNPEMRKAVHFLRQARRCEQINHRTLRGRGAKEEKKNKYNDLNNIAVKGIRKGLDLSDEADKVFGSNLSSSKGEKSWRR